MGTVLCVVDIFALCANRNRGAGRLFRNPTDIEWGAAGTSVAGTAPEPASSSLPLSIAFALATLDSVTRMGLDGLHLMVVTSGTGLSS